MHFWLIQAFDNEHSELTKHSGRQFGGAPKKSGWQEHTARPLLMRQILFGPHGEGSHGFAGGVAVISIRISNNSNLPFN